MVKAQYYKNWQEETMSVQRRKYDSDFKRNAVYLTENSDRTGMSRRYYIYLDQ